MSWKEGRGTLPPALDLIRGKKGGRGIGPRIAIRPEWSAGRRECSRKLMYPMSWPEGEKVVPSLSL